jgi:hypothetical protein
MRPLQASVALLTLGLMSAAVPAEAAWNNVFQVTCWGCKPRASNYGPAYSYYPSYSYSAPAGNACCDPCQTCTTKYVQRCYYQPVTTYTTQTYYEPITTYTTRTYYEPVTTYRYTTHYDPCTCSCQQVATPCTSYVARQQCCPVQSWVQRCCQVPCTSYQKSFYWEPQTTCCSTTSGPPVAPCAPTAPQGPPQVDPRSTNPPPGGGTYPPPQVDGKTGGYDQYYQQQPGGNTQSQFRQLSPNGQSGVPSNKTPAPGPGVKLERIAQVNDNGVSGQIVNDARTPRSGVQVTFVNAKRQGPDKTVTSDTAGQFQVELPTGAWLVYLRTADGQQIYHSRIDVEAKQKTPIVLVSR